MCRATSDNPATLVTSYFTLATHSSMQVRESRLGDVSVVPRRVKVALEDVHDVDESEERKYFYNLQQNIHFLAVFRYFNRT